MEKKYEKKGQSAGVVGAIIQLITGIGVAVLVLIFVGSLGGQTFQIVEPDINEIANNVINNSEFLAVVNGTGHSAVTDLTGHSLQNATLIFSAANGSVMAQSNFNVDLTDGLVYLVNEAENNTYFNASYFWGRVDIRNDVGDAIVSGFSALETTSDYLPIIVLAVVISLVLFLVLGFGSFSNGGGRGSVL